MFDKVDSPTASFEDVSPEIAAAWLKSNIRNRPLSKSEMLRLKRAMDSGNFVLNGDAIRFDTEGVLIDGQKRLSAIAQGDKTFRMLVVRGLEPRAFETIDQGQRRTAGNVLAIAKVANYNLVAAAAYLAMSFDKTGNPFTAGGGLRPSAIEVKAFVDANPIIVQAASMISGNGWVKKYMRQPVGCFLLFLWWGRRTEILEFFDKLRSGEGLNLTSPILHLRERLHDIAATVGANPASSHICALSQKAIIAYLDRKPVKNLRIRTGGENPENVNLLYARHAIVKNGA